MANKEDLNCPSMGRGLLCDQGFQGQKCPRTGLPAWPPGLAAQSEDIFPKTATWTKEQQKYMAMPCSSTAAAWLVLKGRFLRLVWSLIVLWAVAIFICCKGWNCCRVDMLFVLNENFIEQRNLN